MSYKDMYFRVVMVILKNAAQIPREVMKEISDTLTEDKKKA